MLEKNDKFLLYYTFIIFLFGYLSIFQYALDVKFTTHDDMVHAFSSYADWIPGAVYHGRVGYYLQGALCNITLLVDNFIYFKSFQFIAIFAIFFSAGWLINLLFSHRYIGFLYMALVTTLWQNSGGHNLMGSYPFYMALPLATLLLSLSLFLLYIRKKKQKYFYFSLFLWLFTLGGSELWVMYTPLFLLFAYNESTQIKIKDNLLYSLVISKWYIVATIVNILVYFSYQHFHKSGYDGNHIDIHSIELILSTWMKYTLGLAPGVRFYMDLDNYSIEYLLGLVDFEILFIAVALSIFLMVLRRKILDITLSKKLYVMMFLVGIYATIAPNFLMALTPKYQAWAKSAVVTDYVYTSFAYFALVFLLFLLMVSFRKYKYIYLLGSLVISLFVSATAINNKNIGNLYEATNKKFFLIDAFLHSNYVDSIQKDDIIVAPTLWDRAIIFDNTWSKYAKYHTGKSIEFAKSGKGNKSMTLLSDEDKDSQYLIYSEKNIIKAIFASSKECNSKKPCYILHTSQILSDKNFLRAKSYSVESKVSLRIEELKGGEYYKDMVMFEPKDTIREDQVVALLDYNPIALYKPKSFGIEFLSGLYDWERYKGNFAWSSGDVAIVLTNENDTEKRYSLSLALGTLKAREVSFILNGETILKERLPVDERGKIVSLDFLLNPGENRLNIVTDTPAAQPGTADHRKLAFSLADVEFGFAPEQERP